MMLWVDCHLLLGQTQLQEISAKTLLPIPQDELNANPGLKAQQNSGY